ncbi:Zn(II)2Cys6 transcription factor [Aspergillus mulundensis]|uniref:Zn(2)-C6 fungal-type domain-containing protein n=1 Tax=Aspergillus mulundensis TaxID=1810919 RepID=A0A3D8RYF0_9EURO|nr:Uncharacterized protein DSM5745_05736 [Aspergillus mulundensis]RDW78884.1 Uncharacterized protein DSM5745_05736 [Aspergillus mulundensis]
MKRNDASDQAVNAKRPRRQDPVSCESCRKKKLKCDRQRPCGSCLTRQLACSFRSNQSTVSEAPSPSYNVNSPVRNIPSPRQYLREPQTAKPPHNKESSETADWLEHIHMGDRVPAAVSPQIQAGLEDQTPESQGQSPASTLLSILDSWVPNDNPATVELIKFLPAESDTQALFSYFCRYISYLYHIIVPHVVEGQINEVYRSLNRESPVNYNHLALVFAITGSSLFLQCSIDSSSHAARCSQQFSFLTGAALIQANYLSWPTIEGLQAVLIAFHNMSNMHCSASVRSLFTVSHIIEQAKNMMLHQVDTPQARKKRESQWVDPVTVEIQRRLWWDVASFDWCLSFLSGPQEWTYMVNPAFMHTDKPSNIDDAAIGKTPPQPSTTPTSMSFFLERLKLAETCRGIVDTLSSDQLTGEEVEYSKILDLDRKLQEVQRSAPDFLNLSSTSRQRYAELYQHRPSLAWQRCILQQGYYSRLCRLHRPFFIRGARDPAYSYSYMVGLNSARKVLEIKRMMDEDEPRFTPSSSAVWSIMHHVFMAAVILLLDVCYNRDDILDEKRKEEVLAACRMLNKARQSSALVKEGIDAMMGVLQEHCKSEMPAMPPTLETQLPPSVSEHAVHLHVPLPSPPVSSEQTPQNRDLEDIWAELIDYGGNMDFGTDDWTGLFTDMTRAALPLA